MKLKESLHTIYVKKSELVGKHTVLYSGDVRIKTGALGPPQAIHGLPQLNGTYVEYRAVRTFMVKPKRRKARK
jgi:hypothetical protein